MKAGFFSIVSVFISRHLLVGVAVALLASSCGPVYQAPPVTGDLGRISRSPVSLLERGYIVHQQKCAKCHSFENPARYEESDLLGEIMPEMARKSKLDAADEKAVTAYVLAVRKLPQPETAAP